MDAIVRFVSKSICDFMVDIYLFPNLLRKILTTMKSNVVCIGERAWRRMTTSLASHASHGHARDNFTLEEGIEYEDRYRGNKCTSVGEPTLDIASLLDKDQACPAFYVYR